MRKATATLYLVALFALSIGVYYLYGLAWPLAPGRDYGTYISYYAQILQQPPTLPMVMLYRTPIAPLLIGIPLQFGGAALLEFVFAIGYALVIICSFYIASQLSLRTGIIVAPALWAYPPLASFMHTASSDSAFCAGWMVWMAAVFWTRTRPTTLKFALLGAGAVLLTLIRPGVMLPLYLVAGLPFILAQHSRRQRISQAAAYLVTMIVLLLLWQGYNAYRYGDFVVARGQNAVLLYRVFVNDQLVKPSNGPATQELAEVIERDLLAQEPYTSYEIDINDFFSQRSTRFYFDLIPLTDRTWGWDSNYAQLKDVAVEAILAHLPVYVARVAIDCVRLLATQFAPDAYQRPLPPAATPVALNANGLPVPSEGEPIPASSTWWLASTPSGQPIPQTQLDALDARLNGLPQIPARDGNAFLANAFNTLVTYGYPSMLLCAAIGLLGIVVLAPKGSIWHPWTRVFVYLSVIMIVVLGISTATIDMVVQYRTPFDPVFVIFAVAGLVRDFQSPQIQAATEEIAHDPHRRYVA